MDEDALESISENLMLSLPLFYKKLMKASGNRPHRRASYLESPILNMLIHGGPRPISTIGRRLNISKPNMTSLIDKLISRGMVKRTPDRNDRRIINIDVTGKGRSFMREHKRIVKDNIKHNISGMGREDLENLRKSLQEIRTIMSKMPDEE